MVLKPTTDEEGRRWFPVFNGMDEEIPAYGTAWCCGKILEGNEWSEVKLPTKTSSKHGKSWLDLQKTVGKGNLMLMAQPIYRGYGWHGYNNSQLFHNGPTAIPKHSWGKMTQDYPVLARVRIENRDAASANRLKLGMAAYRFSAMRDTFDLVCTLPKSGWGTGWGWGGGWGWGWGGAYGWGAWDWGAGYARSQPFQIVDMVSGYGEEEGLAWVVKGEAGSGKDMWRVISKNTDMSPDSVVKDGTNEFNLFASYFDNTSGISRAVSGSGVVKNEGHFLGLCRPGVYELDITFGLQAIGEEVDEHQNPWARVYPSLTFEDNTNVGEIVGRNGHAAIVAPPVLRQGHPESPYGEKSTYLPFYDSLRFTYTIFVKEPEGYDPFADDHPILAKARFDVVRVGNDESKLWVSMQGDGTLERTGENEDSEDSENPDLTVP